MQVEEGDNGSTCEERNVTPEEYLTSIHIIKRLKLRSAKSQA